jgi:hypothetical protein
MTRTPLHIKRVKLSIGCSKTTYMYMFLLALLLCFKGQSNLVHMLLHELSCGQGMICRPGESHFYSVLSDINVADHLVGTAT